MKPFSHSNLVRSLMTCAAFLAFMLASAAIVRAQTVIGADGANGADCNNPYCNGGNGADGESVFSEGDTTTAIGGAGGNGGYTDNSGPGLTGDGGNGGNATAIGASSATAIGGAGGLTGSNNAYNGNGGNATAAASGPTATAIATGGDGGPPGLPLNGLAGSATAAATAISPGDATSSATATSGVGQAVGSAATANSSATATGFGSATASAVATGFWDVSATSYAETAHGGLAQAQAEADFGLPQSIGLSQSTAKTIFGGVSIQSTVSPLGGLTSAIAQGGSGQLPIDESGWFILSTALPTKAYSTTLIGSASNVADALLGPHDKIFGIVDQKSDGSVQLDFSFQGDLILGAVTGGDFNIVANGVDIFSEEVGANTGINLGDLGPNIDLTIDGGGVFAIGGVVPEPSTWAMMAVGFAGLGFMGWRGSRRVIA
jgi:hypothetical protein